MAKFTYVTFLLIFCILSITCVVSEMLLFAEHANYRRSLQNCEVPNQPRPRFMEEINWDDELAQLAHRQVAACDLDSHYKEAEINKEYKSSVGKNTADNRDPYAAVREWFDEHQYYNYTRNSCSHPNGCSHYKRIVWGRAEFMGCAVGGCGPGTRVRSGQIVVCYYSPMENVERQQPYEADWINICRAQRPTTPRPAPPPLTPPQPITTRLMTTTTEKLTIGPYGRYRCNCECD